MAREWYIGYNTWEPYVDPQLAGGGAGLSESRSGLRVMNLAPGGRDGVGFSGARAAGEYPSYMAILLVELRSGFNVRFYRTQNAAAADFNAVPGAAPVVAAAGDFLGECSGAGAFSFGRFFSVPVQGDSFWAVFLNTSGVVQTCDVDLHLLAGGYYARPLLPEPDGGLT